MRSPQLLPYRLNILSRTYSEILDIQRKQHAGGQMSTLTDAFGDQVPCAASLSVLYVVLGHLLYDAAVAVSKRHEIVRRFG